MRQVISLRMNVETFFFLSSYLSFSQIRLFQNVNYTFETDQNFMDSFDLLPTSTSQALYELSLEVFLFERFTIWILVHHISF